MTPCDPGALGLDWRAMAERAEAARGGDGAIGARLGALLALAWPIVVSRSTQVVVGIADALMVAHLGAPALAATTAGALNAFTAFILPMGTVFIVSSFASQLFGMGDLRGARRYAWYGLAVAAGTAVLGAASVLLVPAALAPSSSWACAAQPVTTMARPGWLRAARRIACPSAQQRRPDGTGYWTTLTASGITWKGQAAGCPHSSDSGTVRPWSTSILLTMVRSKSSWITLCAMWLASSGCPTTLGTGRGPQPSSATAYSAAVPMAKVGIISRLKAVAWSL